MRGIDCSTGSPIESSKVNKAIGLKTKIIDEDGLFDMLRKTAPQPEPEPQPQPAPEPKPRQPPAAPASGGASGAAGGAADARAPAVERAPALWAEKYRPQRVEDLVGNNDHVKRLVQWASTWEANARGGKEFRKAVLLSGPPGVGKTSAARVVLAALGYDVIELNASDTRSKNALQQTAADMLTNTSIAAFATGGGGGGGPAASSKLALIMDEVDGMSSGDRGGMQQLVALIKTSKLPVICCCNDRSSQKVKSLANHCLDLRFRKPSSREVATAFLKIATSEGYRTDLPSVEKVAVACNGDLRGMLNLLQLWRPSGETLNGDAVAKGATNDISAGAFEVWDRFFKQATRGSPAYKPLDGRLRDYFVDSSMTPLLVQEMYPSSPGLSVGNAPQAQLAALNRMASAAESIAESDVVGSRIVREQQWTLSPLQGVLACARPGFFAAGGITSQARFPAFLGRFSTANKRQRLLRECASHMQAQASASKAEVRCSYVPALRSALVRPLKTSGSDGIEATLALLDEYSLTKDDYDALVELQLALGDKKEGEDLPSAVKSALTRAYNKSHRTEPRKLGKASRAAEPSRFDEDGALDDDAEAEDEDEEAEPVAAKPKQKAAASKGKGKAKAR
ncbi:putative clamp loader replication factor C subunit 1 [Emiliania huxleyi CCMP1516]|uniref:AAA+ ATPase domain-containing protein n=2 Tax=Emiliania huxleyi TaxID=2903 RepID=A0A0D3KDU4_EMIH1|nr:putative clamp loader replication factor C subunit 1 [Emiliania huxleyi CCMP1516]EOD33929.1 putative clamp loader replication factor C subunit 1 [Emiliania huxleyi CCMP1516]|eukprot:XP_005786358.1 putative clamp loader replication factor C subunit 1 [Emiliania huxleyi CCMP1516]